jgi:exodeoxyribonuclease VII large subunit
MRLRLDDFAGRLNRRFLSLLHNRREKLTWRADRLIAARPQARIREQKQLLWITYRNLFKYLQIYLNNKKSELAQKQHVLHAIGPRATLSRGYSITRRASDGRVIRRAADIRIGQEVEILLARGQLNADVVRRSEEQHTDRDD